MIRQRTALRNILSEPEKTLVVHDCDGVLCYDALDDVFTELAVRKEDGTAKLRFWEDCLEPFYMARASNRRVSRNPETKVMEPSLVGREPDIGDELIAIHEAVIEGMPVQDIAQTAARSMMGCRISEHMRMHVQCMQEFFGDDGVHLVSGSYGELIAPLMDYAGFDPENIHATDMVVPGSNGKVGKLEKMVATGHGKCLVAVELMIRYGKKSLLVLDDGTTGINAVNYCEHLRDIDINAAAVVFNPNISMMRNTRSGVYFRTDDIRALFPYLAQGGPMSTDAEFVSDQPFAAIFVDETTDIGMPRTKTLDMKKGFVYDREMKPARGSLAEACLRSKKKYAANMVPYREIM